MAIALVADGLGEVGAAAVSKVDVHERHGRPAGADHPAALPSAAGGADDPEALAGQQQLQALSHGRMVLDDDDLDLRDRLVVASLLRSRRGTDGRCAA